MTFVGSTANDAGLNAWITDSTDTRNRASAESILAILMKGGFRPDPPKKETP